MKLIDSMLLKVNRNLEFHHIPLQDLYKEFREEIGNYVIGNIPLKRWDEMAKGLFEAIVDDTLNHGFKAINPGESKFNKTLYHSNFLSEDLDSWFKDYGSKVAVKITMIGANTVNKYRWLYSLSYEMNLLVGADPRDTEALVEETKPGPMGPDEECDYGPDND